MKLIDAFYNEFGGLEVRIKNKSDEWRIDIWDDYGNGHPIAICNDKSLNMALFRAFCYVADQQGMSYEEIEEIKHKFRNAIKEQYNE